MAKTWGLFAELKQGKHTLPAVHNSQIEYFWSLLLSKIWQEFWLLCSLCSIATYEYSSYNRAIMGNDVIHRTGST